MGPSARSSQPLWTIWSTLLHCFPALASGHKEAKHQDFYILLFFEVPEELLGYWRVSDPESSISAPLVDIFKRSVCFIL